MFHSLFWSLVLISAAFSLLKWIYRQHYRADQGTRCHKLTGTDSAWLLDNAGNIMYIYAVMIMKKVDLLYAYCPHSHDHEEN